jgi:hypothetical protein
MVSLSIASVHRVNAWTRLSAILAALLLAFAVLSPSFAQAPTPAEPDDRDAPIARLIVVSTIKPTPASIRIGELFLAVRKGMTAPEFFQALKDSHLGMKEVREARTVIDKAGLLPTFLGAKYPGGGTPVEKTLLEHRRRVTETLIRDVIRSTPADATVFVAKVGSWASKAAEGLTFDGDIDFSFICADMRIAKALKTAFDGTLLDVFGLAADARSADVVATAHGLGDAEVYTGDEGQGFAEQALEQAEAKARAEGKTLVLIERVGADGSLKPTETAFMRTRIAEERGLIKERSARLPEVGVPTDPGLSMEMVRHLLHDIKGSKEYPPSVLIVKASKYLQRSDQSAAEGGNRSTSEMSQQAAEVVQLSQGKDAGALADFLAGKFGQDGVIDEAAAAKYISAVERGVWRNIEVSIHTKADGLDKLADEAERATGAERDKLLGQLHDKTLELHDSLSAKLLMLEAHQVEIPTSVEVQIRRVTRLVDLLAKLGVSINEDELRQKRFVEEMLKAGTPSALKLAVATTYDVATRLGEGINSKLDFIDNMTLAKLRGDHDVAEFLKEAKETEVLMKSADPVVAAAARERAGGLAQRAKLGLVAVNKSLNDAIQSSAIGRGASHGLMAVGLAEELPLYWNTIATGDFDTFAMEFFRHRMPMFSAAEGVYVDGNPSDYVMAGWDAITALVPAIGLGRAAVGIGEQLADAGIAFYWDERLNLFVDEIYAGARFKPTAKTQQGDAWVAEWRLTGVTYRGDFYDLKTFTDNRRDQLKAMAAELRKPAKSRDLAKPLYGHETGLIDKGAVDETLRRNLYASDSLLRLIDELRAHPLAGPALKQQFEDQERVRWEQVKLAFLVELINRLEDRWAHEWALKSGQMPALLAELKRLTGELEITDQVAAKMQAANPSKLKTMTAWFMAGKRDLFLEPDAATAAEAEVGLIIDAVAAYRGVLETRAKIEKQLGIPEGRDGGMRLLTDPSQLHGLPATDRDVAAGWAASVDRLGAKAEDELRARKARLTGVSLEQTTLEAGFDRDALRRLQLVDVWRYAWANLLRAGDAMARPGWLDDPTAAIERLKGSRAALIEEFEAHYRVAGVLEVTVVDAATGAALAEASVTFGSDSATTDGAGRVVITGIQPGRFDLSAAAAGRQPATATAIVFPVPASEGPRNQRAVRLALDPDKAEPRLSSLLVAVTDAADGKPLAGAKVSVSGPGGTVARDAGADGRARFDKLPPGAFVALAEAVDHESARATGLQLPVGASGPSERTVALALKRTPPPQKDDAAKAATPSDAASPGSPPTATTQAKPESKDAGGTKKTDTTDTANSPDGKKLEPDGFRFPILTVKSWSDAVYSRDEHVRLLAKYNLTAADHDRGAALVAALEAQMKTFWAASAAELVAAEAYATRLRAEIDRVYAGFAGKATGQTPTAAAAPGAAGSATVTDLEGDALGASSGCLERVSSERARDLGFIDEDLKRIRELRTLFATFAAETKPYSDAMDRASSLTVDHSKTEWKTIGYKRTFFIDVCGGPAVEVKVPAATIAAVADAPTTPVAATSAPTVRLTIDPASRGRAETNVVAETAGGRSPYRFDWTGARAADGARATYATPYAKATDARARVRLTDSDNRGATAELPLEPAPVTVELTKLQPSGTELAVGDSATFTVRLRSEAGPLDAKDFVLRWEPSTEARFARAEGSGVADNSATLLRPGRTRIWVVALHNEGGALATVAESQQIELEAVASGLTLKVEPASPLVGEVVRITARDEPKAKDGDVVFRWELSGEAENPGPTADPRVYSLVAKSTAPLTVTVRTQTKAEGDKLATAQATIAPRLWTVAATNLGSAFSGETTRPVIWRPGKGLVVLDREIAANQDVALRADITPTPTGALRWAWSVNEGSTLSGNPVMRETHVQRATPGSIEATVVARDERGIELGRASVSVSVSVSDAAVREGRDKAGQLAQLKAQAEAAWSAGDLDGACETATAAAKIQPDLPIVATYCGGRDRVRALVGEMDAALAPAPTAAGVDAAAKKLAAAEAIHAKASLLGPAHQRLEAARTAISANKDDATVDRKRRLELLMSGAAACKAEKWQECRDRLTKGLDGGDKVFTPADAGIVAKAQALLATAEAKLKKASGDQTAMAADRQQRIGLLLAGAAACKAEKWRDCRDAIAKGIDGGDGVFAPADAGIVAKAQALRTTAEAELKKAADDATRKQAADANTDAERKQRLGQLLAGGQACQAAKWAECREAIGKGLAGGDKVFKPEDGKIVDKARALGARAEAEMLKAASAKSATPDTAKELSPPTTPKVEGADPATPTDSAPDNAKLSASSQAQVQPAANQPGAPLDGVYVGRSTRDDGARGPTLTWTIAGSRISLVSDASAEKRAWIGEIKPSGAFKIQVERIAYTGTVAGGSLTGAYAGELRMFKGTWSSTVKGTFDASRITPAAAGPTMLDGVYVGKASTASGEHSEAYTWTVSGSRIEVTESSQQQNSTVVGTIDPSGAFVMHGGPKHATVKGQIVGNTISATWDYPVSEETGVAGHGTLTATRTGQPQPLPQSTEASEEAPPPTSAPPAPSTNGYWKLDRIEYANPHGADEWTKDADKYKILQRDDSQITFHEEAHTGVRLTYSVKWRIPEALVPGQSPGVELTETCLEFKPGPNSTQKWMGTALVDSLFLIGDLKLEDPDCTVGGTVRAESRKWNIRVGRPGLKAEVNVTADVIAKVEYKFVFAWIDGAGPSSGQP